MNEDLIEFLYNLRNTLSSSEKNSRKLRDGSRELTFQDGLWVYRDRKFGINPFGGQEVVFLDKQPIWAMNYRGHAFLFEDDVFPFLKQALKVISKTFPIRGPPQLKSKSHTYRNQFSGSELPLFAFRGREEIACEDRPAYFMDYHGGMI